MNIQINTKDKTVKLLEAVSFKDLSKIKDMLGNTWDQYTLVPDIKIQAPVYVPNYPYIKKPWDTSKEWPYSTLRMADVNASGNTFTVGSKRHREDPITTLPQ